MANRALLVWAVLSTWALANGLVPSLVPCVRSLPQAYARPSHTGVRSPAAGFAAAPTEVRPRPTGTLAVTCGVTDGPGARQGSAGRQGSLGGRQGSLGGRVGSLGGRQGSIDPNKKGGLFQALNDKLEEVMGVDLDGDGVVGAASKRQKTDSKGNLLEKPPTLAEKMASLLDPRKNDGRGEKPNMPIPKWRNGPRGQGDNDGGGRGNVYGKDDRYGKKPKLREW